MRNLEHCDLPLIAFLGRLFRWLRVGVAAFYYHWGAFYARWGHPQRALWYYNRAVLMHPESAQIFYQRAMLFIAFGANERAIIDFSVAIRNRPGYRDAYLNRSLLYSRIGRQEDAEQDLEQAIQLGADRAAAEQELAQARRMAGPG